jgi:hypothetical protein
LLFFLDLPNRPSYAKLSFMQKLGKLDLYGCILFVPAIIMALLALQWGGNQYDWDSATIIGLFVGAGGLLVIFLVWEYRMGNEAMIPFSIITHRSAVLCCIVGSIGMGAFGVNVYYLPEWFQVVKDATAIHSGVMFIPSVLSMTLFSTLSGVVTNKTGNFNINITSGLVILTIGGGLFSTFTPDTNSAHWISYQLFQGIGGGFSLGMPLIGIQAVLSGTPELIPMALALILFFQYFGLAVWLSVALTIFQNNLIDNLNQMKLSGREIEAFLLAGTANVREVTTKLIPEQLSAVIEAYNDAITNVFYLSAALAGVACILSLGIEWKSTKKQAPQNDEEASVSATTASADVKPTEEPKQSTEKAEP